jgi:phosphoribosyl 1,2-cyclic phosphodiesterase
MRVQFWGVRGSIPVPGPLTQRYGGNTSCIQVDVGAQPVIIFDSGTGIRKLGQQLVALGVPQEIHIFISHAHWDHIQGLPFFDPLYQAGNRITFYSRKRDEFCLRDIIHKVIEDPYFPLSHEDWKADVNFVELEDGAGAGLAPGLVMSSSRLNHPLIANAYRIDHGGHSVVYVTDTAPFDHMILDRDFIPKAPDLSAPVAPEVSDQLVQMKDQLVRLCTGADLVIYDTMFTDEEYNRNPHWGHSAATHAVDVCTLAGARHLVIFHHAPERTDDQMDRLMEEIVARFGDANLTISPAIEGRVIEIG